MAMADQIAHLKKSFTEKDWQYLREYVKEQNLIIDCHCDNDRIDETICKLDFKDRSFLNQVLKLRDQIAQAQ